MTVTLTASKQRYSPNGSTDTFAYPFRVLAATSLVVISTTPAGVETTETNYTVTGVNDDAGGNVVMGVTPTTGTLTIYRDEPITQETDYVENDPIPANVIETDYDKGTMIDQQLLEQLARTIKSPVSDPIGLDMTLPAQSVRASLVFGFNASGEPIASSPGFDGTVSAFMVTVLDDETALEARTTLGAAPSADTVLYSLIDGTRAFSATVSGVSPTLSAHLATKGYVDTVSGSITHADLLSLSADDHTQYSLVTGTRDFTGTIGGITPVADADFAIKSYVDGLIQGVEFEESVLSLTTEFGSAVSSGTNRYIAPSTSGTWTEDYIYQYNGSSWDETIPNEGTAVWVEDVDILYVYNTAGNWVRMGSTITHGNLLSLSADDHPQYSLVAGTRDFTGIVSYDAAKTFTGNQELVSKTYVDDAIAAVMQATINIGSVDLSSGDITKSVAFSGTSFADTTYSIEGSFTNTTDANPSVYDYVITTKSTTGFDLEFSGEIDSNNYSFEYTAMSSGGSVFQTELRQDLVLSGYSIDFGSTLTVNGTYTGEKMTLTVDDAATVFGDVLYCAADFNYDRADADSTATSPAFVLALEAGAGSKKVLLRGQICNTAWTWTAGKLYLSTTTGEMTQTAPTGAGDQIQPLGWALSADTIFFAGSLTHGQAL